MASAHTAPQVATGAGSRPLIHELPEELLLRIMLLLERGDALVAVQRVCQSWRRLASTEILWKSVTLSQHAWLTQRTPTRCTWQEYYGQLETCEGAAFVVLGGAYASKGRRYSLCTGTWSDTAPLQVERRGTTLIRDDEGCLYALGGTFDRALRSVERLDPASGSWELTCSLDCGRCCPAAALDAQGHVVVTGGATSIYRHAKVFSSCAILRDHEWHPFPELQAARCAHSLCSSETGSLYATGGYGGGVSYLSSIEVIDLAAAERGWRVAAELPHAHSGGAACLGPDRCLYVVGGSQNGSSPCSTCLRWDPRCKHICKLAPMASARQYFAGAFGPDGRIYVAGGFEWTGMLTSAESYDPRADRWSDLPEMGAYMEMCAGAFVW